MRDFVPLGSAQIKNILSSNLWILLHEDMMFEAATVICATMKGQSENKSQITEAAETKMERTINT